MAKRTTRLKMRRRIRSRKKQVVTISESANKQLDRHIFRRWHNLTTSWRFAVAWAGLILVLIVAVGFQSKALGRYYLEPTPTAGGVYTEGIVGDFTNANPIYATSDVDTSVSKLLFSSLLTYNKNNQLIGDLADSWQVDTRGLVYTVQLKKDVFWHDGKPLTADDIVFTYQTVQNPDTKSPLLSSWKGIKVEKVSETTVRFTLPNAFSPFPHSLTTGIIPEHILKDVQPSQLRSVTFNTKSPVGSGPFKWRNVSVTTSDGNERSLVQLSRYDKYHRGQPQLDGISVRTYNNNDELLEALKKKQIITASGVSGPDTSFDESYNTKGFNLMSANMVFLKNTSPLLADQKVRQAIVKGTNVPQLTSKLGYPTIPVRGPILESQVGFNPAYNQFSYNKQEAAALLDAAGWKVNPGEQFRKKDGTQLNLKFVYDNTPEFSKIAEMLQQQWAEIGVNAVVQISDEKETAKYLDSHDYDVFLYGINIGADPDVYAYWHSSQIDKKNPIHLNLAEYKSSTTDLALEAGRARTDPALRTAKYKPFLEAWKNDAPGIGLYQPRYLYVSNQPVYGADATLINVAHDRFNNVHQWMINTARTVKQ